MAVATQQNGALVALETMQSLRAQYPSIRFSVGLSNVSFGLPLRLPDQPGLSNAGSL